MAAVADLNGNANGVVESQASTIDPQILIDHLSSLLRVTLGATDAELRRSDSLLASDRFDDTLQRCERFAQEAQAASLYIQKLRLPSSIQENGDNGNGIHLSILCYYAWTDILF
jgi:dynein heavy chain 1